MTQLFDIYRDRDLESKSSTMTTVPSQMLWMLVKDWNCYQRKGPQNKAIFSSEPGNLYNKHSYTHSGQTCSH